MRVRIGEELWLEDPEYHLGGGQRYIPVVVSNGFEDQYNACLVTADEEDQEEAMEMAQRIARALQGMQPVRRTRSHHITNLRHMRVSKEHKRAERRRILLSRRSGDAV